MLMNKQVHHQTIQLTYKERKVWTKSYSKQYPMAKQKVQRCLYVVVDDVLQQVVVQKVCVAVHWRRLVLQELHGWHRVSCWDRRHFLQLATSYQCLCLPMEYGPCTSRFQSQCVNRLTAASTSSVWVIAFSFQGQIKVHQTKKWQLTWN